MAARRGISILDVVGWAPPGAQGLLPGDVATFFEKLAILDHSAVTTPTAYYHTGIVQAAEVLLPSIAQRVVEAPGLNRGAEFQLTLLRRAQSSAQTVEPAPNEWIFDLFLDEVSIQIPFLKPARLIPSSGVIPAQLVPIVPPNSGPPGQPPPKPRPVRLVASGVYRIRSRGDGSIDNRFIDFPDPFDPNVPTGAVVRARFDPPHFFLSDIVGLTVKTVTFDNSDEFTPPEIVARGQDAAWQGIAIEEATVFIPGELPVLGRVSFGLRDFLIGSPLGLQGEVQVELGRDPESSQDPFGGPVQFFQDVNGTDQLLPLAATPGQPRQFNVTLQSQALGRVRAQLGSPPAGTEARWTLPGLAGETSSSTGLSTGYFTALPGTAVTVGVARPDENGRLVSLGETRFNLESTVAEPPFAPKIHLELPNGRIFENVTYVGASAKLLAPLRLFADPSVTATLEWDNYLNNFARSGPEFRIPALNPKANPIAKTFLTLRDEKKRTRRIILEVLEKGAIIVGCEAGVFTADGTELPVDKVKVEFDLTSFHSTGPVTRTEGGTTINAAGKLQIPAGVLVEASLKKFEAPADPQTPPPSPPPTETIERVQVRLDFDTDEIMGWGDRKASATGTVDVIAPGSGPIPDPQSPEEVAANLASWVVEALKRDPNAKFALVGRCDDINSDTYNEPLAARRAGAVKDALTSGLRKLLSSGGSPPIDPAIAAKVLDGTNLHARGEQSVPADASEQQIPAAAYYETDVGLGSKADLPSLPRGQKTRLVLHAFDQEERALWGLNQRENRDKGLRPAYRRVDVFAIMQVPPPPPKEDSDGDVDLRKRTVLVPGPDAPKTTEPVIVNPDYPYLMRLNAAWDSPSVADAGDAAPTKLEFTLKWVHKGLKVPPASSGGTAETVPIKRCGAPPPPPGQPPEIYTLIARFNYDARSGETVLTASFASEGDPEGWRCIDNNFLASALALAPGLLPALNDAGIDGKGGKMAAMIGAVALASAFARDGVTVIHGLEIEQRLRGLNTLSGSKFRIGFDYSIKVGWDFPFIKTKKQMKVRYRNVGLVIDTGRLIDEGPASLDSVSFVYESVSIDVEDPGEWEIGGILGKLLRVTAVRSGSGSTFIEIDLGVALDLGVISVTQATIRATFKGSNVDFELRGLEVSVNVPKVLEGSGKLTMDSSGLIKSALALNVIPAGLSCAGSLTLDNRGFFVLEVSTEFSTPIPLASSGLGIFGFSGRFVSNGTRNLDGLPNDDVIARELGWYQRPATDKYKFKSGQFALGLGAVVGTLPDKGFTFHGNGMLAIEMPDLSVLFGLDADFLGKPPKPKEQGATPPPGNSFKLLGILSIDSSAVTLAIRGEYKWRKLLKVDVPISGRFPFNSTEAAFLRVGSDGFPGELPLFPPRPGEPIAVRILPDSLNAKATAFLMIEEKNLHLLGNRTDPWAFNFDGFSVGFGARFEIDWGNAFIGVEASAEVLAGIGFNPLTVGAGVFISGEVHFLVFSAGIKGELALLYREDPDSLKIFGRLCARVGFWRWKKTKCGTVEIGDPGTSPVIAPSPLAGVDLISRLDRVTGKADKVAAQGATVWPDCIPVLHFAHTLLVDVPTTSAFKPGRIEGPLWIGSKDLRFAYKLISIEIAPIPGTPLTGTLPCTWTFPAHRQQFPRPGEPTTGDEARDLHLLSRTKYLWSRNLILGGLGAVADPAQNLLQVCEPVPPTTAVCALAKNTRRIAIDRVRLTPDGPSAPPFSSYFELPLVESAGDVSYGKAALLLADSGLDLVRGSVQPLPPNNPADAKVTYEVAHVEDRGRYVTSLSVTGRFESELVSAEIVLSFCNRIPMVNDLGVRCDRFDDLAVNTNFQTITHNGIRYQGLSRPGTAPIVFVADAGGRHALNFRPDGMRITLPQPSNAITLTVFSKRPTGDDVFPNPLVQVVGRDAFGNIMASVADDRAIFDAPRLVRVQNSDNPMSTVEITGGFGLAHVTAVCYEVFVDPLLKSLTGQSLATQTRPRVRGIRLDGQEVEWIEDPFPPVPGVPVCSFTRFRPRSPAIWRGVKIQAWSKSNLGIVRVCGVTWEADRRRQEEIQRRQDFINEWNNGVDAQDPGRLLLNANTRYLVRARWQAKVFQRPQVDGKLTDELEPPADPWTSSLPVQNGEDVFFFKTAAEPAAFPADAAIDVEDETTFDPRRMKRYIALMRPDIDSPPHFTDDPVRIHYLVPFFRELLARYQRRLNIRVAQTDPPAGSVQAGPPVVPPFKGIKKTPLPKNLVLNADVRIIEAALTAPCLKTPDPEGGTDELTFDFEPSARYDLIVEAPAVNGPRPTLQIARTHFRTSRFASPEELVRALGFSAPDPDPFFPLEMVVETPLPATAQPGDQAFDQTLTSLGLDPLPLPDDPRVIMLLLTSSGGFQIAGFLLDCPEPIQRPGRLEFTSANISEPSTGTTTPLVIVRSTDSGTRLLLAPAAPVPINPAAALLTIQFSAAGQPLTGARFLYSSRPRLAEEILP